MEEKINILLCEDDQSLGMLLCEYLQTKNYNVTLCMNGEEGYKTFLRAKFDCCIFDVMMPIKDGFTLAAEIRQTNKEVPIIFLTAKNLKEDTLTGFKLGADDYITKPFSMEELVFRIEAIMRHVKGNRPRNQTKFQLGIFEFDSQKQLLTPKGEESIKLTTKENELLLLLCNHTNEILQREFALKTIWIDDNYFNARSMDVYITKLRKYLKPDPQIEILNVHGKGYKLILPSEEAGE